MVVGWVRRAASGRAPRRIGHDAAPAVLDHVFEFVAVVPQEALHGPRGRVTECAACPYGYELPARGPSFAAGAGPLRCRPTAACDKGACTQCVQSALTPWLIGTCDACIEYGCNPDTGRCACNEY